MFGISNHREYYSEHYFAELLAGDLKETLDDWKARALERPDSEEHREPPLRLCGLAQSYFRAIEKLQRSAGEEEVVIEAQRDFLASDTLGLTLRPCQYTDDPQHDDPQLPGHAPVASSAPKGRKAIAQGNALGPTAESDPSPEGAAQGVAPTWEEILGKDIFGLPEPPRWVIFLTLGQIVL